MAFLNRVRARGTTAPVTSMLGSLCGAFQNLRVTGTTPVAAFSTSRIASNDAATAATTVAKSKQSAKGHGLWAFFEDGVALPKEPAYTGRAWRATELRQKNFEDLHRLWYILLRERNMLSTQRAEAKRHGVNVQYFSNHGREVKCRQSMARILTVLRERHLAYERAVKKHRRDEYIERKKQEREARRQIRLTAQAADSANQS